MSKAHDALHIVFSLHAGFLQSYEVDERKRMLKCYHIVCDTEDDLDDLGGRDTLSDSQMDATALQLLQESLEVLLRLASNYVAAPMRQIPTDLDAAEAAFVAFREGLSLRMVATQPDRIRHSLKLLDGCCVPCIYGASPWPSVRYTALCKVQWRVRYVLRDIDWVWQTGDDVWDWVLDILQRLRNN